MRLRSKRAASSIIAIGALWTGVWVLYALSVISLVTAFSLALAAVAFALAFTVGGSLCSYGDDGNAPQPNRGERIFRYDWLIALVVYSAVALVFFHPAIGSISTALIGPPEDNLKYLWNMWWGGRAVFGDDGLAYTNMIFYPEGTSLLYNDYSWYNLLLSILLKPLVGAAAIYNLLILHTFVLSGLGGFFLTRYFTRDSWVSMIGGYVFAFNPSHFAHSMHHLNIASIQFIPFFVLFFIKAIREGSLRSRMLATVFFLLCALCDWNYLIFNCVFIVLCYIYLAIGRRRVVLPDVLKQSALVAAMPLVLMSPWLVPMVYAGIAHPEIAASGHNLFVADLVAMVIPHFNHLLSNVPLVREINGSFTGNAWESAAYLGIVNIILVVIILLHRGRLVSKLVCAIVPFAILSMGSYLHILGRELPVILPYRIIEYIPFLQQARNPSRIIVFVYLFLAVAVAAALKHLFQSLDHNRLRGVMMGTTVTLVFLAFFSICRVTSEVSLPDCYEVIAQDSDDFGVLDLPSGWESNARYMMYQTMHGIPIVQGLVPRKIGRSLVDNLEFRNMELRKQQLAENHVKYIVLHKNLLAARAESAIRYHEQAFQRVYSDAAQVVFRVY